MGVVSDETNTGYYHPISIAELDAMDIPDTEFIIQDIIADGAAVLLSGREKSGKGHLLIDAAVSVATGQPCFGKAVLKEGPVLYCSLEESPRTLRQRFRRRLDGRVDAPVDILPLDGFTEERFQLENVAHLKAFTELLTTKGYILVIIDTLREAHSGRENDSDEMAPLVRRIRDIAHGLGVTIVVSHHMNKAYGSSRGSTAILASFDDEIAFTRSEDRSDTTIRGELRAEGRNLPKYVTGVVFDAETGRWQATDEVETIADPNLRQRILDVLDNSGQWLSAKDLDIFLDGASLKSIQNRLSEMRNENPPPFAQSGQPRKGNPRKYHSHTARMDLGNLVDFPQPYQYAATGTDEVVF